MVEKHGDFSEEQFGSMTVHLLEEKLRPCSIENGGCGHIQQDHDEDSVCRVCGADCGAVTH